MPFDTSPLSSENVLRDIHDPVTQTIRTSATAVIAPGLVVEIDHTNDSVAIGTTTQLFTGTTVGPKVGLDINIINTSIPLPANAATESTLNSILTGVNILATESTLSTINSKIVTTVNGIKVDGSAVTQPVSQIGTWNINLPTNAATDTLQTAGNNILTNIDNKLPVLGQHASAGSVSVVLASDQTLTVNADLNAFSITPDSVLNVGSIDGTATGTKFGIVNNRRQQILDSHDRQANFTYADFGTKDQRVTQIDYTSPTFAGITAQRIFNYTLVGTRYKRDDEVWSIV